MDPRGPDEGPIGKPLDHNKLGKGHHLGSMISDDFMRVL